MKNLDTILQKKQEIISRFTQAMTDDKPEEAQKAFLEFADMLQEAVTAEAKGLIAAADNAVLNGRGTRALTSEETSFYEKFIQSAKLNHPQQAFTGTDDVIPKTVIDAVFEDLASEHPLLNLIDFQPTGALIQTLTSTTSGVAKWGRLDKTIADELSAAFAVANLQLMKLSAFVPVAKSMLDLGPIWIDRYVRAMLSEALASGLEEGIVDGDGLGDGGETGDAMPIGMTRSLTVGEGGVYPRKTPVTVTALDPVTIGNILNTISQGPNGKRRNVSRLLMVVNPADYFTKVYPATTPRTADGMFAMNALPYPMDVVVSAYVPASHAIFGLASKYMMYMGTSKGGKLEYDDSYKFLEDVRTYLIKLYGNGRPKDTNAFVYADISGLVPYVPSVTVTNTGFDANVTNDPLPVQGIVDARLASLTIGALTLTPSFNKSVFVYAADTTNATNTISAVAMNGEAEITIMNGETEVANGTSATWATGANTVTITVTIGGATETYTVIVTKS